MFLARSKLALLMPLAVLLATAAVAAQEALPELLGARLSTTAERGRLIIDLSAPADFRFFSIDEPDRIVVELGARAVSFDPDAHIASEGLVNDYRIGLIDAQLARAVLMLAAPAQVQQAFMLDAAGDQPARLVVDIIPDSAESFAERVAALQGVPEAPAAAVPDIAEPASPSDPQAARPLIVLDPGHGGIDSGARAPNGLLEKTLALRFALDLQAILIETGKFDVALTRDRDEYLTLEQRVALARRNRADLMVSLHADSFDQSVVRGAAIYTRDEQATDVLSEVLAEQENKVDLLAGFSPPEADEAVVDILVDLMRREARRRSFRAASLIVNELERAVRLRRFPLRRADFFVLQAPEVPSILVELGFLSNADDTSNLADEAWRQTVARALATGIEAYFDAGR